MTFSAGVVAMVPARIGSTRFPGKMLKDETGLPLVVHVARAVERARRVDRVVIATDAPEIERAARAHGVAAVLTGEHANGTSRLAEGAALLGLDDDTLVVNAQGDEPELDPASVDGAIDRALARDEPEIATLATPFCDRADVQDPNQVKVVIDRQERALYFSRAPIPHDQEGGRGVEALRHIGLYVYRVGFLRRYVSLEPGALEGLERLEQLRALEHGYAIGVRVVGSAHVGIDTPEQYADFVARWRAEP